jgi:NADH dehydrogenase
VEPKHVVIVGAGFGGLYAARALASLPIRLTVIDRRNHHLFQPLLYQVATAALNPSDVAHPIRAILRHQRNATVLLGEVRSIERAAKRLELADGTGLSYDLLIVATGATHSYFGRDDWAPVAPGLKTIEDALEIRRRVLLAYEAAEREATIERRAEWLTFVVVGAGATGVELAGALAEIARHALARDFRNADPKQARVLLVEGMGRVLPPYAPELSESAARQLRKLGVEVKTNARVTTVDERGVTVQIASAPGGTPHEERIAARTVLWAAGVSASPLARSLGVPLDRAGRVKVNSDLTLPDDPSVFVIGDLAFLEQDGKPIPGVAPAAIQEGQHVGRNVFRALRGERLIPFRYRDKGSLATIGRAAAVADFGTFKLSGFLAWFAWLAIHIFFLIGFRNRAVVLFSWAWAWFTYERGARLITGPVAVATPAPAPPSPPRG